jgi:hypothetical protein
VNLLEIANQALVTTDAAARLFTFIVMEFTAGALQVASYPIKTRLIAMKAFLSHSGGWIL